MRSCATERVPTTLPALPIVLGTMMLHHRSWYPTRCRTVEQVLAIVDRFSLRYVEEFDVCLNHPVYGWPHGQSFLNTQLHGIACCYSTHSQLGAIDPNFVMLGRVHHHKILAATHKPQPHADTWYQQPVYVENVTVRFPDHGERVDACTRLTPRYQTLVQIIAQSL